jgi:hypothetical protein
LGEDDPLRLSPFGAALFVACAGNLVAVLIAATVFREPPGSAIRPMHVPVFLLGIAACTGSIGFYFAQLSWRAGEKLRATVAMALCLMPLFIGMLAFVAIVRLFDYTLKP